MIAIEYSGLGAFIAESVASVGCGDKSRERHRRDDGRLRLPLLRLAGIWTATENDDAEPWIQFAME